MSNQHSKCDDCYKTHLPEAHDRTILPSEAFSEGYVPEFNQASEDKLVTEVTDILNNNLDPSCECQDCIITWSDSAAIPLVVELIRTEKLRLLAEVRERAQSMPIHGGTDSYSPSKYVQAVSIDALTKLEAEL